MKITMLAAGILVTLGGFVHGYSLPVDLRQVDSAVYFATKEKSPMPPEKPEKVTDIMQAKRLLKGRVTWGDYAPDGYEIVPKGQGELVCAMTARNGEHWGDENSDGYFFVAYYPQEDILLLEGGHTSDESFNLTTGQHTEEAGNPDYIVASPSGLYRLNGWFPGQECSVYFIQERAGEQYRNIVPLNDLFQKTTGEWLCTVGEAFWESDDVLFFAIGHWGDAGWVNDTYYRLVLK
jgi:hypothetical protein